jgi:hypothetical protein
VETNAEFDAALEKAKKLPGASYIEIQLGCEKLAPAMTPAQLERFYQIAPPKS